MDNIGPFIALIDRVIIIIPLLICYKYERKGRRLGAGKKGERERERERERKVISLSLY